MKFEVGMYCYDKTNRNFGIGKITGEEENQNYIIRYKNRMTLVPIGNIIASHSTIDLIKAGDYVNGFLVDKSRYGELYIGYVYCGGIIQKTKEAYATFISDMKNEDIKTILTKEQFETYCYEVGGNKWIYG